jgi:hypothetical protein
LVKKTRGGVLMFDIGNNVEILVGRFEGKSGEIVNKTTELGGLILYHILITDIRPAFTMAYKETEIELINIVSQ